MKNINFDDMIEQTDPRYGVPNANTNDVGNLSNDIKGMGVNKLAEAILSISKIEGQKGDKGDRGEKGERGEDGHTPIEGVDYSDGKDGRDGVDGNDGKDGSSGKDGKSGATGKNGKDGKDGKTPVFGEDYFDGKNGSNGKDGARGDKGERGERGDRGVAGARADYYLNAASADVLGGIKLGTGLIIDGQGVVSASGITAGGGILRSISSISTNTTAGETTTTDYVYLVTGTTTLTLPTAVGNTNKYTVTNVGSNIVTVETTSSQTINGSLAATLPIANMSLDFTSNNNNWVVE